MYMRPRYAPSPNELLSPSLGRRTHLRRCNEVIVSRRRGPARVLPWEPSDVLHAPAITCPRNATCDPSRDFVRPPGAQTCRWPKLPPSCLVPENAAGSSSSERPSLDHQEPLSASFLMSLRSGSRDDIRTVAFPHAHTVQHPHPSPHLHIHTYFVRTSYIHIYICTKYRSISLASSPQLLCSTRLLPSSTDAHQTQLHTRD